MLYLIFYFITAKFCKNTVSCENFEGWRQQIPNFVREQEIEACMHKFWLELILRMQANLEPRVYNIEGEGFSLCYELLLELDKEQ